MSHTDKTRPYWVRLREIGADEYTTEHNRRGFYFDIPRDFKWTNAERGPGREYIRWAKRYRSKQNRRRDVPHTSMRGYGYGHENYRMW